MGFVLPVSSPYWTLHSFQNPNFFFGVFPHPGLWVVLDRFQQVLPPSQHHPSPRHKPLYKSLHFTFRVLFQGHADFSRKEISIEFARKQNVLVGIGESMTKVFQNLVHFNQVPLLHDASAHQLKMDEWAQRRLDTAAHPIINLCSDTLSNYTQFLEYWGGKCFEVGFWQFTFSFLTLSKFLMNLVMSYIRNEAWNPFSEMYYQSREKLGKCKHLEDNIGKFFEDTLHGKSVWCLRPKICHTNQHLSARDTTTATVMCRFSICRYRLRLESFASWAFSLFLISVSPLPIPSFWVCTWPSNVDQKLPLLQALCCLLVFECVKRHFSNLEVTLSFQ